MWDYSFAFPTLLILFIILGYLFSLPRLSIRQNRVFVAMLIVETLTIVSDILSSYACNQYKNLPMGLVIGLNVFFFIAFFTRMEVMYYFALAVFGISQRPNRILLHCLLLPYMLSVLVALITPFTGWIFYFDEAGYHSGPWYNILYICGFWYVLLSVGVNFLCSGHLKRRREKYSMLIYSLCLLIGLILRLYLPKLLLMNTFALMAIIVVYLAFENPEYYLELGGVVFNGKGLRAYLDEYIGIDDYKCLGVGVRNYYEMRDIYGAKQLDAGLNMIGKYCKQQFPKIQIFYHRKGRFVLLGKSDMDYDRMIRLLADRFRESWQSKEAELYLDVGFAKIEISRDMNSSDAVLRAIVMALERVDRATDEGPIELKNAEILQIQRDTIIKRNLEDAIENDKVEVFLQPLVDANTGEVTGAEALARIRDEEGKIIPPGSFISIAEKSGRINELGEQVFEKTCQFIRDYPISQMGVRWINVNLSPIQFLRSDLADRFLSIAEKYNVDPRKIHMEITEESLVDDNFLRKQIEMMEAKGFLFVLDDYGTGYSNLSRLKRCPFINIKLDRSLVCDYYRDPDEILPTMIQAFKHMGFGVTAEGVEDEDMVVAMKKIGCDYLQGYLYSKPIPMDEFAERYIDA